MKATESKDVEDKVENKDDKNWPQKLEISTQIEKDKIEYEDLRWYVKTR